MNYSSILANSSEEDVSRLAFFVLEEYTASKIKLLSGPQRGLVMLRVRETVANSQFNAGEILVTEVRLELDGQFGYGIVIGDSPGRALGVALVDAALRKGGSASRRLEYELAKLQQQLQLSRQRLYKIAATTRVDFEVL